MFDCHTHDEFGIKLDVRVRLCVEDDLPQLEWFGLFTEHREIIESAFARQARGDNLMLLAELNRFPIGQVWIDLAKRRYRECALLWAMRVLPPLQGQGIGSRLLRSAERVIRARGFPAVEVGAERSNPAARRFYERQGYRVIGAEQETYSYTSPWGVPITVRLDEWVLRKTLARPRLQGRAHEALARRRD